ncbi:hypothetical protein CMI38_01210 [Candidatus Pacearchaeota archaeon]|jgi:hypothetical protein|nr:hypothetical protein [Candidatus Pacearchaeota archaeon]
MGFKMKEKEMKDPLYVFIHVPKCAGTTIRENIIRNFDESEVLQLYGNVFPFLTDIGEIRDYLESLGNKDIIKVIFGHWAFYGIHELFPNRDVRYVLFLRDPVSRTISHYNWDRGRYFNLDDITKKKVFPEGKGDFSFSSWFKNRSKNIDEHNPIDKNNFIFRFLSSKAIDYTLDSGLSWDLKLSLLKEVMDKMYFVGISENKLDVLFVYKLLGLRNFVGNMNVSTRYLKREEIRIIKKRIKVFYPIDYELYDYALFLNRKFKNKSKNFYHGLFLIWVRFYVSDLFERHWRRGFYHYHVKEFYFSVRRLLRKIFMIIREIFRVIREILIFPFRISLFLKSKFKWYKRFVWWFKSSFGIK